MMSNSSSDNSAVASMLTHMEINKTYNEIVTRVNPRLPNGIVVAVLMMIGFVGNVLVLFIYYFRIPRTVFSIFVIVLALLDLLTTMCGMPIDVVIKSSMLTDMNTFSVICKISHFEVYGTGLASGSVLLLIAVTRYRKVCQPLQACLSKQQARFLCIIIISISMAVNIITIFIKGPEQVKIILDETASVESGNRSAESAMSANNYRNITLKTVNVVEVTICRTDPEHKDTVLYYALNSILILAFVTVLLCIVVLHCRISHSVAKFNKRRSSMHSISVHSDESSNSAAILTITMFRIFATITVVFIISYLPHLVCLVISSFVEQPIPRKYQILMDLAYNSPYINVIANPFIYGFRSAAFRANTLRLLCGWWKRRGL